MKKFIATSNSCVLYVIIVIEIALLITLLIVWIYIYKEFMFHRIKKLKKTLGIYEFWMAGTLFIKKVLIMFYSLNRFFKKMKC